MLEKLKKLFDRGRQAIVNKAIEAAEVVVKEEKGASDIVAIIVIIAIILVVAAIFREQLSNIVTSVFENLADFVG